MGITDFRRKEPITSMQFMIDRHFLWIQTAKKENQQISGFYQMQIKFYRIPLKKPGKLSDLAWFSFIHSKSRLKGVNPQEEAENYLPYYSEIRAPFEN